MAAVQSGSRPPQRTHPSPPLRCLFSRQVRGSCRQQDGFNGIYLLPVNLAITYATPNVWSSRANTLSESKYSSAISRAARQ